MCLSWFTGADFELFCRLQSELERRMTTRGVWTLEPWENYLENGSHVWQDWDEIEFKDGGWYCAQHAYCNVRVYHG